MEKATIQIKPSHNKSLERIHKNLGPWLLYLYITTIYHPHRMILSLHRLMIYAPFPIWNLFIWTPITDLDAHSEQHLLHFIHNLTLSCFSHNPFSLYSVLLPRWKTPGANLSIDTPLTGFIKLFWDLENG